MLFVVGGTPDSGVGARAISMPGSSSCYSGLSAQQLVCHPGVGGAGHLIICSNAIVGDSVVLSAFQLLCWLHLLIEVELYG